MLTGPKLGAAIEAARKKKGVTKKALADEFGVSAPSVQDWVKRGTIDKDKLSRLWRFFQDVAGPDHWGLQNWTEDQHPSGGMLIHPVAQDSSPPKYHSGPIIRLRLLTGCKATPNTCRTPPEQRQPPGVLRPT